MSDLRFTLRQVERAYNVLQAVELNRRRIPLSERLTVEQIGTGQSIEVIAAGGLGLLALWRIADKVFQTRKTFWESEKAKWEAKSARLEHEDRNSEIEHRTQPGLPPELQAESYIQGLIDTLQSRGAIRSIEFEVDRKVLRLGISEPHRADRKGFARRFLIISGKPRRKCGDRGEVSLTLQAPSPNHTPL